MIKIIFFDIDNTLIPLGATQIEPKLINALHQLQAKGIKLVLATGRPSFYLPHFDHIHFDAFLTFNGQYCFNATQTIYANPLSHKDIMTVLENAKQLHKAVALTTSKKLEATYYQSELERYFAIANQSMSITNDLHALLHQDIYQMMIATKESQDMQVLKHTHHLQIVRWIDFAADIIPLDGGKAKGMEAMIKHYGIHKDETMAFGDGGNDAEMVQFAHIGVAMGNALDQVKAIADYVTSDVDKDGLINAFSHFGLL